MRKLIAKSFWLGLLAISLSACTNSPVAWKLLYGQFDNLLSKQLIGYAEFTDSEKDLIRLEVDKTVLWHRQSELPRYADTIAEFQKRFLREQSLPNQTDMDWLLDEINAIGLRFDENSPLLPLIPVLAQLTDVQVEQIAQTIDEEFIDAQKELDKEANQYPAERAEKSIYKFLKRLGLSTNKAQRRKLIEALQLRQLDRGLQQEIWREWSDKLLNILNSRTQANFAERFTEHHFARINLIENTQPEKWAHDQALFKNMFLELLANLQPDQKLTMNQRLEKFKEVALELNQSV